MLKALSGIQVPDESEEECKGDMLDAMVVGVHMIRERTLRKCANVPVEWFGRMLRFTQPLPHESRQITLVSHPELPPFRGKMSVLPDWCDGSGKRTSCTRGHLL